MKPVQDVANFFKKFLKFILSNMIIFSGAMALDRIQSWFKVKAPPFTMFDKMLNDNIKTCDHIQFKLLFFIGVIDKIC